MNQCLPLRFSTARYNDVLALGEYPAQHYTAEPACSLEHLGKLGFMATAAKQEHWIVTRAGERFEIHLYGAAELAHFAARQSLIHRLMRCCPERTATPHPVTGEPI